MKKSKKLVNLSFKELNEKNWMAILEKLIEAQEDPSKGSCVMFLGPEALISKYLIDENDESKGYKPLLDLLCEKALEEMKTDNLIKMEYFKSKLTHFTVKESFMAAYGNDGETLWNKIFKNVYDIDNLHPVFYEKFPFIPIPILINTSPDLLVKKLFIEKAGIRETQFSFYNYTSNSDQQDEDKKLKDPELDTPFIYNLFGSINNPSSIVSSPKHLLDYVFSMLTKGQEEINDSILSMIKLSQYYIFLGFDFESWHLKLLLRFFEIKGGKEGNKVTYARPWKLENEETMDYFTKLFNVTFVKYNIVDFINELYERCLNDPSPIKLRAASHQEERGNQEEINKLNLREFVKNGKITEALELLERYFYSENNKEMIKKCVILIQSFNDIVSEKRGRRLTREEFEVKKNQISTEILNIIDDLKTSIK